MSEFALLAEARQKASGCPKAARMRQPAAVLEPFRSTQPTDAAHRPCVRQCGRLRPRCCKFAIPGRILEMAMRASHQSSRQVRIRWRSQATAMVAVHSWIGAAASNRPNLPPSAPSALAVTFIRVGLTSMAAEALAIGRRGASRTTSASPAYRHLCRLPGRFSGSPCQVVKTARNPNGFSPGGPSVLTHPQAHPQPQQFHTARSRWIACPTAHWSASSSRSPLPRPSTPAACPGHSIFALSILREHTHTHTLPSRTCPSASHFPPYTPSSRPFSRNQLLHIWSGSGTTSIRIDSTLRRSICAPAPSLSLFAAVTARQHNRRPSQSSPTHHRLDMSLSSRRLRSSTSPRTRISDSHHSAISVLQQTTPSSLLHFPSADPNIDSSSLPNTIRTSHLGCTNASSQPHQSIRICLPLSNLFRPSASRTLLSVLASPADRVL
ncbi:hypothetical protein L1887_47426 [Cichorium endivia]|nr:hypothetical protein L1887_47426 [Cichorium endivia]